MISPVATSNKIIDLTLTLSEVFTATLVRFWLGATNHDGSNCIITYLTTTQIGTRCSKNANNACYYHVTGLA